jgi:hypothetical protein
MLLEERTLVARAILMSSNQYPFPSYYESSAIGRDDQNARRVGENEKLPKETVQNSYSHQDTDPTAATYHYGDEQSQSYNQQAAGQNLTPNYSNQWQYGTGDRGNMSQTARNGTLDHTNSGGSQQNTGNITGLGRSYDALGSLAYASQLQASDLPNQQQVQSSERPAGQAFAVSGKAASIQQISRHQTPNYRPAAVANTFVNGYQGTTPSSIRSPPVVSHAIKYNHPQTTSSYTPSGHTGSYQSRHMSNLTLPEPGSVTAPSPSSFSADMGNRTSATTISTSEYTKASTTPSLLHRRNESESQQYQPLYSTNASEKQVPATTQQNHVQNHRQFAPSPINYQVGQKRPYGGISRSQPSVHPRSQSPYQSQEERYNASAASALGSEFGSNTQGSGQQYQTTELVNSGGDERIAELSTSRSNQTPTQRRQQDQFTTQSNQPTTRSFLPPQLQRVEPPNNILQSRAVSHTVSNISTATAPTTVNPSQIYNPYHVYKRQAEVAEAAINQSRISATAASSSVSTSPLNQSHSSIPPAPAELHFTEQLISSRPSELPNSDLPPMTAVEKAAAKPKRKRKSRAKVPAAANMSTPRKASAGEAAQITPGFTPLNTRSIQAMSEQASPLATIPPSTGDDMARELRLMAEKMREYQQKDPNLFSQIVGTVRSPTSVLLPCRGGNHHGYDANTHNRAL